jgi:hypothetical protein
LDFAAGIMVVFSIVTKFMIGKCWGFVEEFNEASFCHNEEDGKNPELCEIKMMFLACQIGSWMPLSSACSYDFSKL